MATQYGEDRLITDYFEKKGVTAGRFLDIGAGDGVTFSNTKPLLDRGWSGVMVDPAPSQLRWLYHNYADNDRVQILGCAIADVQTPKPVTLYDGKDFSTINVAHKSLIDVHSQNAVPWTEHRALAISWWDLLRLYPGPYDFVNIDVEGNNCEVLGAMPDNVWYPLTHNPFMVCVEIDPAYQLSWMKEHFSLLGFSDHETVGGNLLAWT